MPNLESDNQALWSAWHDFHYQCDAARWQKLISRVELVRMVRDAPGDIVDAGAYKGASTIEFAQLLNIYQPNSRSKVIAFDSFGATFPHARPDEESAAADLMSSYDRSAYGQLVDAIERLGLTDRIALVEGDVGETMPQYIKDNPGFRISLLHCDLDAYQPTLSTLQAAWQRVVIGGVAVFDEYAIDAWGESDAVDKFFSGLETPPTLKMLSTGATPTAYCLKERY